MVNIAVLSRVAAQVAGGAAPAADATPAAGAVDERKQMEQRVK